MTANGAVANRGKRLDAGAGRAQPPGVNVLCADGTACGQGEHCIHHRVEDQFSADLAAIDGGRVIGKGICPP